MIVSDNFILSQHPSMSMAEPQTPIQPVVQIPPVAPIIPGVPTSPPNEVIVQPIPTPSQNEIVAPMTQEQPTDTQNIPIMTPMQPVAQPAPVAATLTIDAKPVISAVDAAYGRE